MGLSQRISERTPADRDRYLDVLRVTSILLVVTGHWLVRAVTAEAGELQPGYMLALEPWTQWLTLIVQVLPIFFLVGGALNAQSWRRARARGTRATDWLRRRARRLLLPLLPLLFVWIAVAAILDAATWRSLFVFDPDTAVIPVWFLAAYLVVTALTPATLWLHERAGGMALIAVATAVAIIIDVLRFTLLAEGPQLGGQPAIAALNFPVVIVIIHQLGYLWADDRLPRRPHHRGLIALVTGAALAVMIGSGLYPLTMVPIAGTDAPNNLAPPSAALIALGLVQLGVALLLRRPVTRWLERPRAWVVVALPGSHLMTIFLWHQTAMLAVTAAVYPTGLWPVGEHIDATWWLTRPLWILLCAIVLALLALAFGKFESVAPPAPTRLSRVPAGLQHGAGVLLTSAGIAQLIDGGLTSADAPLRLPLAAMVLLILGLVALGVVDLRKGLRRRGRRGAGKSPRARVTAATDTGDRA